MTEDQTNLLKMYLTKLRDGEDYTVVKGVKNHFIQCGHHRDAFDNLLTALGGEPKPSTADETEAAIRAQLMIWSTPSP
jgi:hypothetical protein